MDVIKGWNEFLIKKMDDIIFVKFWNFLRLLFVSVMYFLLLIVVIFLFLLYIKYDSCRINLFFFIGIVLLCGIVIVILVFLDFYLE